MPNRSADFVESGKFTAKWPLEAGIQKKASEDLGYPLASMPLSFLYDFGVRRHLVQT
jgi:hypothetical protein